MHGQSVSTGSVEPSGLPRADAPRHERAVFMSRHKICFVFAFQGAYPHHDRSFNHDDFLIPAGYFKSYASKKRSMNQSGGGREGSRLNRRLYALSDEQVELVAAEFDKDVESAGDEGGYGA